MNLPEGLHAPSDADAVIPHLSASQLSSFADCGERFRLERVEHLPQGEAWWNVGGHAVHRAYEDVVVEALDSPAAVIRYVEHFADEISMALEREPDQSRWRKGGRVSKANPDKEDESWWLHNGSKMAERFATMYDTPFLPGKVVELNGEHLTEVEFLIEIDGHPVKGFIDAIVADEDGSFMPRDYKSGSRVPASALQLGVYAEAMRQLHGVQVTHGQFLMTRTMTLVERPLHAYTYDTLARLFGNLQRAKDNGVYLPSVGPLCGTCGVNDACSFGPDKTL